MATPSENARDTKWMWLINIYTFRKELFARWQRSEDSAHQKTLLFLSHHPVKWFYYFYFIIIYLYIMVIMQTITQSLHTKILAVLVVKKWCG